jgi:hypothetical protein
LRRYPYVPANEIHPAGSLNIKLINHTNGLVACGNAWLCHVDVTPSSLSFACAAQYAVRAIKQHGRTVRAVGSGSGGINRLPVFRGQLLRRALHGPFSRNAGT